MDTKVKIIVAGLVAILCVALVWSLNRPDTIVYQPGDQPLGALAGPDIPSPYLRWGDVAVFKAAQPMATATTTVCALQSPAATSTLLVASAKFDVSTSTATNITLAKAATAFATTTDLGTQPLGANAQASFVITATSTPGGAAWDISDTATTFAPSTWFTVGVKGGKGTVSPEGTCTATWQVL